MAYLTQEEQLYLEKIRSDVDRHKIVLLSPKGGKAILGLIDRLLENVYNQGQVRSE